MREIGSIDISDRIKIKLQIGEYKGEERIDLREYLLVKEKFIPLKKGINFSVEWIEKFTDMMKLLEKE